MPPEYEEDEFEDEDEDYEGDDDDDDDDDDEEEEELEDQIRSAQEVAKRALVLYAVIDIAQGVHRENVLTWVRNNSLWDELTPEELAFVTSPNPTESEQINFSWKNESLLILLWSLGLIEKMPPLNEQCDTQVFSRILPPYAAITVSKFIEQATLFTEDELFDLEEVLLDSHWETRDAHLSGKPKPEHLDIGIIQERHLAINWVLGHKGQSWDDVTTDT